MQYYNENNLKNTDIPTLMLHTLSIKWKSRRAFRVHGATSSFSALNDALNCCILMFLNQFNWFVTLFQIVCYKISTLIRTAEINFFKESNFSHTKKLYYELLVQSGWRSLWFQERQPCWKNAQFDVKSVDLKILQFDVKMVEIVWEQWLVYSLAGGYLE